MDGLPLLFAESEVAEGALLLGAGRLGQHAGQLGDALAVATGIGALGIDGPRDQLDEGLQQLFLLLQQALVLDGGGGHARQRLD
ncbi:hypothetical protein D3C84_318470 [compost metagenome]